MGRASDSAEPPTETQILREMFGRKRGGVPREVREQLQHAADAVNAHERGMSVPNVALHYRFEPGQAMIAIATCCRDYGFAAVAPHVSKHIMSLVQAQYPGDPDLRPSPRPEVGRGQ